MNEAHLHLVVNHFPIIGTFFGIGILVFGLFFKNEIVKRVAFSIFTIAAIFTLFSMATGEGAEEVVENISGISKDLIEEHEELAEKLAIILYGVGLLSVASIVLSIKNNKSEKYTSIAVLLLSLIAAFLAIKTGVSGGEIRHSEIRNETLTSNTEVENSNHEDFEND